MRYLLEALHNAAKREGSIFQFAFRCAGTVMKYLERLLKFMNRNAYIVCAVYGKGLCSSASNAISLIVRNALRVLVLNKVGIVFCSDAILENFS